jgi:hypothetical protein
MTGRWGRVLASLLGVGLLAWAGTLAVPRLLGVAAGPEAAILSQLKAAEAGGLSLPVPGAAAPLVARRVRVGPTTVQLQEGGHRAVAVVLLDFTGALGETEVSALGYERVPFVLREGRWVAPEGLAPRLVATVAALEARRQALEQGATDALAALRPPGAGPRAEPALERLLRVEGRTYRVDAWLLRSERDEVTVAERYRLTGRLPGEPVAEEGLRNLSLSPSGEKLYFSPGLM